MKKILSLVLSMVFVLSLVACGGNKKNENKHEIDVEYYAKLGQISNVEYKLGDSIDEVKTGLEQTLDDHGEPLYFEYTSGDKTIMTDGEICCCYKTDDATGITYIVKYGDAYGFSVGTMSSTVRDAMSSMEYTATEREAKTGELFFLPAGANMTVLEYKIKENTVLFVFQEHALSATVIYK